MADEKNLLDKQAEMQESMMQLEIIKAQLDSLSQQGEIFELTSAELIRAKETLSSLDTLDGSKEILIPIGGDTFLHANISDVKKIMISIGSRTVIEQDKDDAIKRLDDRLDKLKRTNENIIQTIANLQQQATNISMKVQQMSKDLQGQVNPNVSDTP